MIISVEINVEGVSLEMCKKRLLYDQKSRNNCQLVKDTGHF